MQQSSLLLFHSAYRLKLPCALSCRDPHTQLQMLLYASVHTLQSLSSYSSLLTLQTFLIEKTSFLALDILGHTYLYNSIVCGPWVDPQKANSTYIKKGKNLCDYLTNYTLCDHNLRRLYIFIEQNQFFAPKLGLLRIN